MNKALKIATLVVAASASLACMVLSGLAAVVALGSLGDGDYAHAVVCALVWQLSGAGFIVAGTAALLLYFSDDLDYDWQDDPAYDWQDDEDSEEPRWD